MEPNHHTQLANIEHELQGIRKAVEVPWYMIFFNGVVRGVGFVVGTTVIVVLAGWLIIVFDLVPGLTYLAQLLRPVVDAP